jgi:hypothetical protein
MGGLLEREGGSLELENSFLERGLREKRVWFIRERGYVISEMELIRERGLI